MNKQASAEDINGTDLPPIVVLKPRVDQDKKPVVNDFFINGENVGRLENHSNGNHQYWTVLIKHPDQHCSHWVVGSGVTPGIAIKDALAIAENAANEMIEHVQKLRAAMQINQ